MRDERNMGLSVCLSSTTPVPRNSSINKIYLSNERFRARLSGGERGMCFVVMAK